MWRGGTEGDQDMERRGQWGTATPAPGVKEVESAVGREGRGGRVGGERIRERMLQGERERERERESWWQGWGGVRKKKSR